jgi:hypothetical protein
MVERRNLRSTDARRESAPLQRRPTQNASKS